MSNRFSIGLFRPKTGHNYGSAMRSALAFGCESVQLINHRYKAQISDTNKSWAHIPVFSLHEIAIPYRHVPVAVELSEDAISLPEFEHPLWAFYLFGPEDGTLGKEIRQIARHTIQIPSNGCLNLANAVSIVLYDRVAKQQNSALIPNHN